MASTELHRMLRCIVVGAGNRGYIYSNYALDFPSRLKVVAVADPKKTALDRMVRLHSLPSSALFSDWREIAAKDKFADFVIVTTPDQYHKEPVVSFAEKGYHILVEKPMAVTEKDCKEMADACRQNNVMLCVGHVLRYYPPMKKIKDLIDEGRVGDVVNIQHREPVGYWHFAHSYVRGNWRNETESTFSLLAKCCHDIDLIMWWMAKQRCEKISSFGSLIHFRKENKPEGASSRCMDCKVEQSCPYSAKRLYIGQFKRGNKEWPIRVICNAEVPTLEKVTQALEQGPYGRCVYECDNDVNDNQVVNMQFSGGATASLTMIAYTERICQRTVRVSGTKGEISYSGDSKVTFYDFLSGHREEFHPTNDTPKETKLGGHGGADYCLFHSFICAVATNDPSLILSGPEDSLASHLLVFAAERARRENRIVDTVAELPSW